MLDRTIVYEKYSFRPTTYNMLKENTFNVVEQYFQFNA